MPRGVACYSYSAEYTRANAKKYRDENLEKVKAYAKAYREAHREEMREYQKTYKKKTSQNSPTPS